MWRIPAAAVAGLMATAVAWAQPALEHLEKDVRSRVAANSDDQMPPARPTAARPAVERGYLGARLSDEKDRGRGVRVIRLVAGGPAERAGLRLDDLITSMGGVRIRQMPDAVAILEQVPAGGTLNIEVLRSEKRQKLTVVFGQAPSERSPGRGGPAVLADPPALNPVRPSGPEMPLPPPAPGQVNPPLQQPDGIGPPSILGGGPLTDRERIEMLQRRVSELEKRVEQLEQALRPR
jgi:hypothetical protein